MKISLLYTSRRGHLVRKVIEEWLGLAKYPGTIEVVLTADTNDRATATEMLRMASEHPARIIGPYGCPPPHSAAQGWNEAALRATGDILIAISDDFHAFPQWDERLINFLWEHDVDPLLKRAVVLVSDGIERASLCATLPILTYARYRQVGYIYHPAYPSMFNDNELAEHAANDGCLLDARHLVFPQDHYINGKRERDAVDAGHSSQWHYEQGRRVFEARKALGFPVDRGPRALHAGRVEPFRPIALIMTIGDDFALREAVESVQAQGCRKFFFAIPDTLWNGALVSEESRQSLEYIIAKLHTEAEVWRMPITVSKYRHRVRFHGDVEGRVRNAALAEIVSLGFRDVLILDDDEVWRTGLLDRIAHEVSNNEPAYILTSCVPVVGYPGMPVGDSMDRIGVYIDAKRNRFIKNRTPYVGGSVIDERLAYHFTACRIGLSKIADKMRTSAHYDDAEYRFDDWIKNRLPYFAPGDKNVHPWNKAGAPNVWPRLRNWSREEWAELPPALRVHLRPWEA